MTKLSFIHKRFIAGAVCPECHQQDKIVLNRHVQPENIECIECGFIQHKTEIEQKK